MKRPAIILIAILISFNVLYAQDSTETQDPFETALEAVGLTKDKVTFDYGDMSNFGGDKFVMPLFCTLHPKPFKVETYLKVFRESLLQNCRSLLRLSAFASQRTGEGVRRGLISNPLDRVEPLLESANPLYDAIVNFEAVNTIPMDQDKRHDLRNKAAKVPLELQKLTALIIYTSIDSLRYHFQAFRDVREDYNLNDMRKKFVDLIVSEADTSDFSLEPFIEEVDFKYLYTPAQDIAMAVDLAVDSLSRMAFNQQFEFEWKTSAGKVIINDSRNQKYDNDAYFLIIDVGGDDAYNNAAANTTPANWISILIDVAGNDIYAADDETVGSFGAGIFGYAYLVDMAGNDTYSAKDITQGVGLCGVGMLLDLGGKDKYDAHVGGQGCGFFGQGVLSDVSGDDYYHAFQMGQGMGFTKGCGLLIDSTGNDRYVADDSIIDFPSSQSKDHNTSLCQGVGFGKRADFIDGHSWAGGIGMLIDGTGNDHYSAGLFAQGCAYWYAIGALSDLEGDDIYDGIWYVQGSGAHFGLGVLLESRGNDIYTAPMNMAQGAGHDFTLGMLIEEDGNDVYNAPNLSLGGGNANGIGIFWDKYGDDTYNVSAATTLGRSNIASRGGLRDYMMCLGLFLDTGGTDTYPAQYPFAKNDSLWIQHGTNTEKPLPKVELGVGYDTDWKPAEE
jgi:hypothetical protein